MHNKYKIFKEALYMICFVNLVIIFNLHSIKFSETCLEKKLVEKNRFAVCQKFRAHDKVVISSKETFQLKVKKCLPCILHMAYGELISLPCA